MRWHRGDRYYIESDCKRYTVCKVIVMGVTYYEGWIQHPKNARGFPTKPFSLDDLIHRSTDRDEVIQAVEDYERERVDGKD